MSQKKFEWSMLFAFMLLPFGFWGFGICIGALVKGFCWVSGVCH